MPRPGGNPDLEEYQFRAKKKDEPNRAKLTIRIPENDYEKLLTLDKWQDLVREKIKEIIETKSKRA